MVFQKHPLNNPEYDDTLKPDHVSTMTSYLKKPIFQGLADLITTPNGHEAIDNCPEEVLFSILEEKAM